MAHFLSDYGMLLVLLAVCVGLSVVTYDEQHPGGAAGGDALADEIAQQTAPGARVLIVVRTGEADAAFADALARALAAADRTVVATVRGEPADARKALDNLARGGERLDVIAA